MPVAALFATMLTLGKLSSNSELTALRSVGVPFRRIFGPILILGLILSAISYGINDGIVPLTKQRIRTLDRYSILAETNPVQNRDVFIKTPENLWFFIKQVNPQQNSMQDVTVLEVNPVRQPDESPLRGVIHAREASWDGDQWTLQDGVAHQYNRAGIAIAETPFQKRPLEISADLATLMQPEIAPAELTSTELRQQIQAFSGSNLPTEALRTEWHLRFSLPLASFFAVVIAAPLAVRPARRAGRFNSIAFAIVLVFVYYVMLSISRSLGEAGAIAPWLASWSHNIAFGSIGSLLLLRYLR
ncbi:MAG: LptF/LptG family permease [Cyanobacteria bacterium J06639_1]